MPTIVLKKLFAILLLSIYLFNLAGYSLLFQHFIDDSDSQLVKQLDNNKYDDKDLVEVKVPLNMPYINNTKSYERVDGQLEHNGVHYNYVKRKIANDTLYVLCIPNVSKTQLYSAKAAYSKEVNDIPANKKTSESIKKAGFVNEYNCTSNQYIISLFIVATTVNYPVISSSLQEALTQIPEQPPKAFC